MAGARADGWSVSAPYLPPGRLGEVNAILTDSAREAGRDPRGLVRLYNVTGAITPGRKDLFHGPAGQWAETLTMLYTDYQMNTFVFWPEDDRERQSRIFAEDVVPPSAPRSPTPPPAASGPQLVMRGMTCSGRRCSPSTGRLSAHKGHLHAQAAGKLVTLATRDVICW